MFVNIRALRLDFWKKLEPIKYTFGFLSYSVVFYIELSYQTVIIAHLYQVILLLISRK